jgi:hypothetical protein
MFSLVVCSVLNVTRAMLNKSCYDLNICYCISRRDGNKTCAGFCFLDLVLIFRLRTEVLVCFRKQREALVMPTETSVTRAEVMDLPYQNPWILSLFNFLYLNFPYNWMSILASDSFKARANYESTVLRCLTSTARRKTNSAKLKPKAYPWPVEGINQG